MVLSLTGGEINITISFGLFEINLLINQKTVRQGKSRVEARVIIKYLQFKSVRIFNMFFYAQMQKRHELPRLLAFILQ